MNTTEKNTRAAAIVCHLNAVTDNRPRPEIHGMADLTTLSATSLLAELEALFAALYPDNPGCRAAIGDFRAKRSVIIAFRAHGSSKRKAEMIAKS